MKNHNKISILMLAGAALRSTVSPAEAQLISRYLSGREA